MKIETKKKVSKNKHQQQQQVPFDERDEWTREKWTTAT